MNLSGNPIDYVFAFVGGVLISFTPCVYPLIPVSAGWISAKSGNSKIKSLILSLVYVSGITVTYSIMGLVVSLTGMLFGRIATHPVTLISVGALICLSGILMWLDFLNISWHPGAKIDNSKRGYFSTFILGVISGFIASPCLTPALGAILAYLATKKNIFYGITLLASFAYGMGLILVLSGTFSSILLNLPKSGKWMIYVKKVCSLALVFMGLYFIYQGIRSF